MSMRDKIAEIAYGPMLWTFEQATGKTQKPWVDGGNSLAQDEARRAADAIMKLVQARIDKLEEVLLRLEYWFDTDDEILEEMDIAELEDHKRQHRYILAALKGSDT